MRTRRIMKIGCCATLLGMVFSGTSLAVAIDVQQRAFSRGPGTPTPHAAPRGGGGDTIQSGLPACDDGGVCNLQVGITGPIAQSCNDGQWVSLAFPVQTDGVTISAINMTHNTNQAGGDLYLMGDCGGNPDLDDILYTGCEAIVPGSVGPQVYPIDPPVTAGAVSWVVAVFRSSFSFDVAFTDDGSGGTNFGLGYGNLSGSSACGEWADLAEFGFGYCYCVSLEVAAEEPYNDGRNWQYLQFLPDANFYEIRDEAEAYYAEHPDAPGQNSFRRFGDAWDQRVNTPENTPGDFSVALGGMTTLAVCGGAVCPPASTPASNWRPLGPFERPDEPTSGSTANGVGIVVSAWVNPTDHDHIRMGAELGGLWETKDGGGTWVNLTDPCRLPNLGVTHIAVDPTNYNTIYIVVGFWGFGLGVLESTDGGATWNQTGLAYSISSPNHISSLVHHPILPDILYAAVGDTVKKTIDGGTTWTTVLGPLGSGFLVSELKHKPGDPTIWYATSTPNGTVRARIWKLDDSGGTPVTTDITPVLSTGFTPNTGGYLLAVTPAAPDNLYAYYVTSAGHFVIKSPDSGTTWHSAVKTTSVGIAGAFSNGLVISPTDEKVMYLAGIQGWKSINEGASFTAVTCNYCSYTTPNYAHDDIRAQLFLSGSSPGTGGSQDTLLIFTDGGPYKTVAGGTTWTDISGYGLNIAKIYGLGTSYDHTIEYIGLQDLSSMRYDYSTARWWNPARIGDAYESVIDPFDSSIVYTQGNRPSLYKSTDAGQTLSYFSPPYNACDAFANVRPMLADLQGDLYIGHHDVWQQPVGGSWMQLSDFTASFGIPCSRALFSIAVAPSDPNRIYAAFTEPTWCADSLGNTCTSGCCRPEKKIFRTKDGGTNWTDITQSVSGGSTYDLHGVLWCSLSHIEVDPTDPDRLWVSFGDYWAGQRVWYSDDAGEKWYNVSQGLPDSPVHDIVYQKCSPDHLYAGTDQGVYFWDSAIGQWTCWSDSLPLAIIQDLEINDAAGTILAATHGRGLWEADLVPSNVSCGCKRPPSGMVLWMSMDEPSGTSAFNAVGGNPGTHINGPTVAAGEVGNARFYDRASSQYTNTPSYPAIELGGSDFSIDFWIQLPNPTVPFPSEVRAIASKMVDTGSQGWGYTVWTGWSPSNGMTQVVLQLGDGVMTGGVNYYSTAYIGDSAWHHVAIVCDRSVPSVSFYLDGAFMNALPILNNGSISNTVPLAIGAMLAGGSGSPYNFLDGGLDELEVFARGLTETEILALYNAGPDGKCRFHCQVPSNIAFCPSETSRTVTAYLCNNSYADRSLTYWFQGMAGGSGCTDPGPTGFTPSGQTTVTVPKKTCLPITLTIERPAWLNANYQTACYIMLVKDNFSNEVFSCRGSVLAINPCGLFPIECCPPLLKQQPTVFGPVTVMNESATAMDLSYRFRVVDEDAAQDVQFVSLDGLVPGSLVEGFISLGAGESTELDIGVELLIDNPLGFLNLLLEADVDGDGVYEPIASTFVRAEIPECAAALVVDTEDFQEAPDGWVFNDQGNLTGGVARLVESGQTFTAGGVVSEAGYDTDVFEVDFDFEISNPAGGIPDGSGAPDPDGLAIVVAGAFLENLGTNGFGLGYKGLPSDSFAIEFDCFENFVSGQPNDPDSNHVGLDVGGSVESLSTAFVTPDFDETGTWHARIRFENGLVEVYVVPPGGSELLTYTETVPVENIPALKYFAFTSGTGANSADTDVDNIVIRLLDAGCDQDCNGNGVLDSTDIADGSSSDNDGNGVPDDCESPPACEGDANGDGTVDPLDSGYVLSRFGCSVNTGDPDCDAADVNADGTVDPLDSGYVLARFGGCL